MSGFQAMAPRYCLPCQQTERHRPISPSANYWLFGESAFGPGAVLKAIYLPETQATGDAGPAEVPDWVHGRSLDPSHGTHAGPEHS